MEETSVALARKISPNCAYSAPSALELDAAGSKPHSVSLATTKDDYSLESYVLGLNHYQIEMLANLDRIPEAGALVMVTWPKPEGGTGFPARVIAILP